MKSDVDYKALKENGFMRQVQKDRFSMRLKVVGGNLTADQLVVISDAAKKYGAGRVHLTSRQSVEIPFIRLEDVEAVRAELAAGGVKNSVSGPRVRTVTACQGSEICSSGCIDTHGLAVEIDSRYFGRKLPHKFKIGVTGCMNNCLKAEENDLGIKGGTLTKWVAEKCTLCGICVRVCREDALTQTRDEIQVDRSLCNHCGRCVKACPFKAWQGRRGYILSFGGLFGNRIARGESPLPIIRDKKTLFRIADAALNFFQTHGKPRERFLFTIERIGWETFKKEMEAAYRNRKSL